jgi:hypothetical protein
MQAQAGMHPCLGTYQTHPTSGKKKHIDHVLFWYLQVVFVLYHHPAGSFYHFVKFVLNIYIYFFLLVYVELLKEVGTKLTVVSCPSFR